MPHLQLKMRLIGKHVERVELALEDLGAVAVSLTDAEDDAILEPKVGELRIWPHVILTALFDEHSDRLGLLAGLAELIPSLDTSSLEFEVVADQEWTRVWMDQYEPMRFGSRLWVCPCGKTIPSDEVDANAPEPVIVELDPGLAFGSGTHATTALCLQWLDELATRGELHNKSVLDFGCGSGILAIAALKLGAKSAIGIDNDPQALIASRDNAERNGVADRLSVFAPGATQTPRCDIVLANILAGTLIELADLICDAAAPDHPLALSGILAEQAEEVASAYAQRGRALTHTQREDWIRLSAP